MNSKSLQQDLNPEALSLETNIQPSSQTGQMIELCCEYLSVQCISLNVLIMSYLHFRVTNSKKN